MKTYCHRTFLTFLSIAGITGLACSALAQDNSTATTQAATQSAATQSAATQQTATVAQTPAASAPQLPYGVAPILQLAQAKVGDDTIIAYVRNSGNSYNLSADQIIYLQQQGLSAAVINTMLSQPKAGLAGYSAPAAAYASQPDYSQQQPQPPQDQPPSSAVTVGPAVTAIDPTAAAAASTYYYPGYSYPYYPYPYYYPAYGWYPGVSVSVGWGWRGGYGYRGGYGWRGSGGWRR